MDTAAFAAPDSQSALLGALAVLTPVAVALIRALLPGIPKRYLPLAAPILGALAEVAYNLTAANPTLPPGVVTLVGASGVAVREVVDQWKKAGGTGLLPLLVAGCLLFPQACSSSLPGGGTSLREKCYLAGQAFAATGPLLLEVKADPRVGDDVKAYIAATAAAADKSYTACVAAATAGDAAEVAKQVSAVRSSTAMVRTVASGEVN